MKLKETVRTFLRELGQFQYRMDSRDLVWDIIFPGPKKKAWSRILVTKYGDTFYLNHFDGSAGTLEVKADGTTDITDPFGRTSFRALPGDPSSVWALFLISALKWFAVVRKDWIKANLRIQREYPLNRRTGVLPHALLRASHPDIVRLDKELGDAKAAEFVRLVEEGYFSNEANRTVTAMSSGEYFNYCKIAYCAGKRKEDNVDLEMTGREMYKQFADGRHEGLLDIDENSKEEFADWIDGKHPKKTTGGHPWEIKRGGNTTHINLSVHRPHHAEKDKFEIELCGESIGRLAETIRMFLAIQAKGFPITIRNPEGVRQRLLAQDNIGIIPGYDSLHRANQHFQEKEHVFDVWHYDELGRFKRRLTPFITWEPLPLLKPVS